MTQTTTAPILISKKGFKELHKAARKLEHTRSLILSELRDQDKIDNHEQRLARIEKLSLLESTEGELADIRYRLEHAKLLPRKRDALKVAIGSVVDLMDQQGRLIRYTLVDTIEANPSDGRLSILSPLGQSLLGKTVEQTIEWTTGRLTSQQMKLVRIM